jgi:hypothetical protein
VNPPPLVASLTVPEQWSLAAPLLLIACWVSHRLGRFLRFLLRRAQNRRRVAVMRAEVGALPPVKALRGPIVDDRAALLAGMKIVSKVGGTVPPTSVRKEGHDRRRW